MVKSVMSLFVFSRIAITITTSKKHVREGRRICLFVCNAELISPKLQMVLNGAALNGVRELGWCKAG
jgi:hypothetical protein